jgi:hypothetical protein
MCHHKTITKRSVRFCCCFNGKQMSACCNCNYPWNLGILWVGASSWLGVGKTIDLWCWYFHWYFLLIDHFDSVFLRFPSRRACNNLVNHLCQPWIRGFFGAKQNLNSIFVNFKLGTQTLKESRLIRFSPPCMHRFYPVPFPFLTDGTVVALKSCQQHVKAALIAQLKFAYEHINTFQGATLKSDLSG